MPNRIVASKNFADSYPIEGADRVFEILIRKRMLWLALQLWRLAQPFPLPFWRLFIRHHMKHCIVKLRDPEP